MAFLMAKPSNGSGRCTNAKANPVSSVARAFAGLRTVGDRLTGVRSVSEDDCTQITQIGLEEGLSVAFADFSVTRPGCRLLFEFVGRNCIERVESRIPNAMSSSHFRLAKEHGSNPYLIELT